MPECKNVLRDTSVMCIFIKPSWFSILLVYIIYEDYVKHEGEFVLRSPELYISGDRNTNSR